MAYPTGLTWYIQSPLVGAQPINTTSTTQLHPIGEIVKARDDNYGAAEFIYLKGVANTAKGDAVIYDLKANTTVLTDGDAGATSAVGMVAVAMSANVASQYGWYCISGAVPVNTGSNTVGANAWMYITNTAAQLDDAVTSDYQIAGMVSSAANSGGFTVVVLDRPSTTVNV